MLLNQRLSKLYLLLTIQMQRFAYLVCMRVYVLERGGGGHTHSGVSYFNRDFCVCVCVCVCVRERGEGGHSGVSNLNSDLCVCVCVRERGSQWSHLKSRFVCVCVCVCVRERERGSQWSHLKSRFVCERERERASRGVCHATVTLSGLN